MAEKIQHWAHPPNMMIDPEKDYKAIIFTEKGEIVLTVTCDQRSTDDLAEAKTGAEG